jgi:hypothetical protein
MYIVPDAWILSPPVLVSNDIEKGVSPLWRTKVRYAIDGSQNTARAYVKKIPDHELVSECFCSVLLSLIGIPTPQPLLVKSDRFWNDDIDRGDVLFGTTDADHQSLRMWYTKCGREALELAIKSWPKAHELASVDEWILNIDRNMGNLLYDGDNGLVAIDHGRAFGRCEWGSLPGSGVIGENILSEILIKMFGRLDVARQQKAWLDAAGRIESISKAVDNVLALSRTAAAPAAADVKQFLNERAAKVPLIIQQRNSPGALKLCGMD